LDAEDDEEYGRADPREILKGRREAIDQERRDDYDDRPEQ
jgi:hypothetical protein